VHHAQGIRTKDGKAIPLDIIVYATGYFAYSDMKRALTFQVHGWTAAASTVNGGGGGLLQGHNRFRLPNYFKVNGPNTGTGHSSQISYMEAATDYIVQAICAVKRDERIKAIDARPDLQDATSPT